MLLHHKSQSALEYLMTYGWAILIIVIVAVILYSMGIFNPASSISSTITGFSATPVSNAICTANGVLRIAVGDTVGHRILIKNISATSNGKTEVFTPTSTVDPNPIITSGNTYIFSIPNVCPAAGTRFSANVNINYTEPTTSFSTSQYTSTGTVTGTVSSTNLPAYVAYFNGAGANFHAYTSQITSKITFSFWGDFPAQPASPSLLFLNFTNSGGWGGPDTLYSYLWGPVGGQPAVNLVLFATNSTGGVIANGGGNTQVDGRWHFVSFEATDSWVALFVDGSMIYNDSTSSSVNVGPVSLQLGENQWAKCYMYNLQIYDSILPASQISALYTSGFGSVFTNSGTVSEWLLNGTSKDYSGNNNNGIINSEVEFTSNYPAS
jgi:hypothetical protein